VLNNSREAAKKGYYGYLEPPGEAAPSRGRLRRRQPARR
jgi:hypothetical protein